MKKKKMLQKPQLVLSTVSKGEVSETDRERRFN